MDLHWEGGALSRAKIVPSTDRGCTILHAAGKFTVADETGAEIACREDGHRLCFEVEAGRTYVVAPKV